MNNTRLRRYFYGPGIDEPISMIDYTAGSKMYYYHFDPLGSVVALSDVNGILVERYEYDVFGEPTILAPNNELRTISSYGNPYMFTGRRYDTETGLYYYRARYFAPEIGRFLQTDPLGYWDGLNLYTYVGNNPINSIDPTGQAITATGIAIIAGGVALFTLAWWQFKSWRCRVWARRLQKKAEEIQKKHTEPNTDCLKEPLFWKDIRKTKEWKKVLKYCSFISFAVPPGVR